MSWFQIAPPAIKGLPIAILDIVITIYLFGIRRKSTSTWLLAAWFACLAMLACGSEARDTIANGRWSFYINRIVDSVAVMCSSVPLIQFTYFFLGDTYRRERKVALLLPSGAVIALSLRFVLESVGSRTYYSFPDFPCEGRDTPPSSGMLFNVLILLGYCWPVVVLLRKSVYFSLRAKSP